MEEKEKIILDKNRITEYSKEFLEQSKSNQFYGKNVFFTKDLFGSKYLQFQIIGNLGGFADDREFSNETDFFIISNKIFDNLTNGNTDKQLMLLEKKLNSIGKKHKNLKILTEKVFLEYIEKRSNQINDLVTLDLINKLQ